MLGVAVTVAWVRSFVWNDNINPRGCLRLLLLHLPATAHSRSMCRDVRRTLSLLYHLSALLLAPVVHRRIYCWGHFYDRAPNFSVKTKSKSTSMSMYIHPITLSILPPGTVCLALTYSAPGIDFLVLFNSRWFLLLPYIYHIAAILPWLTVMKKKPTSLFLTNFAKKRSMSVRR